MRVQTLSLLTRNAGSRLDSLIPDNTTFYLSEIREHLKEDKIDELEEDYLSQYLQSLLQILAYNVKNSDKVLIKTLEDKNKLSELKELLSQALHYNPNMPDFLEYEDEDEVEGSQILILEDMDSDQMQQDTSWKVRKAAIKILRNFIHVRENHAVLVDITKSNFDRIMPLINHVDNYVNEDLIEYLIDVWLL